MNKARFDYLFVSDLHISQGYDAERRAYHPREDFDEPFFRWLCWEDLKHQAKVSSLDPQLICSIYQAMVRPLLLNRPLAWFLFSPPGHALKAVLILAAVALVVFWYVAAVPWLAALIPAGFPSAALGPALRRLAEIVLWFGPFLLLSRALQQRAARMGHDPYLSRAVRRIHAHLAAHDPALRFYIIAAHSRAAIASKPARA